MAIGQDVEMLFRDIKASIEKIRLALDEKGRNPDLQVMAVTVPLNDLEQSIDRLHVRLTTDGQ